MKSGNMKLKNINTNGTIKNTELCYNMPISQDFCMFNNISLSIVFREYICPIEAIKEIYRYENSEFILMAF